MCQCGWKGGVGFNKIRLTSVSRVLTKNLVSGTHRCFDQRRTSYGGLKSLEVRQLDL